jgi:GTPase SAR1 family protein
LTTFRPLTLADCPLLADSFEAPELLELANQIAMHFTQLSTGELRAALDREDGQKLQQRFRAMQDRLTRSHYRVGFLGTSSAGKSTIFNLVLQEKIAESGAGDATTSLPSRLRYKVGDKTCQLIQMTRDQYRGRLEKLFAAVGLGSVPDAPEEQLALIDQLKPTPEGADASGRVVRLDDLRYLKAFIRTYQLHGSKLGTPPKAVPFDQRSNYINHSDQRSPDAPSESLLLIEAQLFIANENLPERLELCDLPGLNSKRTVDNIITQDYLDELDGALLFVNVADNLMNAVLVDMIAKLTYRYGDDLCGRAWVVFNKCDSLTESHYFPESGRRSVFDNIRELLTKSKVPLTQVCFTSRRLVDNSKEGPVELSKAAALMGLPESQAIPSTCPDEMKPIWVELLQDGGVSRLRKIMLEEMARSVANQIRLTAKQELTRLKDDVTFFTEAEKRRRTGGVALRDKATQCRNRILQLREGLASRATELPALAELREFLRGKMANLLCPDSSHADTLKRMSISKLEQQFRIDAPNLEDSLNELLVNEVLDKVYAKVGEFLEPLPAVPVGRFGGLGEAWQEFRNQDRKNLTWGEGIFPSFRSTELLNRVSDSRSFQHFDGEIYLDLMGDKVRVAVGQVIHGLRTRLRGRLGELEEELDRLLVEDTPAA